MQLNCDQSYHGSNAQHTDLSAESCFCVSLQHIPPSVLLFSPPIFLLSYRFLYTRSALNASETLVTVGEVTVTTVGENIMNLLILSYAVQF